MGSEMCIRDRLLAALAKGKIKQSMNAVMDEFVNYAKSQSN